MPPESTVNISQDLIFDLSESTREEVLRHLPLVFGSLTLSGTARSVSRAIPKLLHVPPSEVIGHHFDQFLSMLDSLPLAIDFAEMLKPGSATLNLTLRCRGDQLIATTIYFFVIYDTLGQPDDVLFVIHEEDEEELALRKRMAETADRVSRLIAYGSSNAEIGLKIFDLCREIFATPGGWLIPRDAQGNPKIPIPFGGPLPEQFVGPGAGVAHSAPPPRKLPADQDEPLAVNSLQYPRIHPNMDSTRAEADTLPHAVAPILNAKDESIGDIYLVAPPGHLFQRHELLLMDVIADQIGQAMERGELHLPIHFQDLAKRVLIDPGETAPDIVEIIKTILYNLAALVPLTCASLLLEEGDGMRLIAAIQAPINPDPQGHFFPYAKTPLNLEIMRSQKRIILDDVRQDSRFQVWAGHDDVRSWMGLPLIVEKKSVGIISVSSVHLGAFSQRDGEVAQAFADQAAIVLVKAQLAAELHVEKSHLELLYRLSQKLAATLEPQEVAEKALQLITETLGNCFGEVYVTENGQKFLQLLATQNYSPQLVEKLSSQPYLRMGAGITGGAVELRRPILVPNVHNDSRWVHVPDLDVAIQSVAAIPLSARDEVVGVMILGSPEIDAINHTHLPLFQSIAAPVALALQNARLFAAERSRRQEAEMLRNAASAVTLDLSLEQILHVLLERLRQVVHFDSACVLLWEGKELHALAAVDLPRPKEVVNQRFPVDGSFFADIQREQRAIFFDDVQALPRFSGWGGTSTTRGWMGVPLIQRGAVMGYITLDSLQVGSYGKREAFLAQAFADRIAITIVNAHLLDDSRRAAFRQQEISAILRGLNSALSLAEIQTAVAEGLHRLIDSAAVETAMYQPDEQQVNAGRSQWAAGESNAISSAYSYAMDKSAAIPVLLRGQSHVAPDITQESQWPVEREWAAQGFRSQIVLPLQGSSRILGHIRLLWRDGIQPNLTIDFSLRQVADGVAMAAERLDLLSQTMRRADELHVLIQLSSQLRITEERAQITQIALNICQDVFRSDHGYILVPTAEVEMLEVIAHGGPGPSPSARYIRRGESIAGSVFSSGIPYRSPNVFADPMAFQPNIEEWGKLGVSFSSAIYAPLRAGDEIIGVLSLSSTDMQHPFTQADLQLLKAIAEIVGAALHRSAILEGLEQRVEARTADLARANVKLLELDQLKSDFVANVSHELRTPLTNIKLYLDLLGRGRPERREHYLEVIKGETDQLQKLIESILDFSSLEKDPAAMAANFAPVSLNELMETIFHTFRDRVAAASLDLIYAPAEQPVHVWGDRDRLFQIAANLLMNAITYTKPGGKVELGLTQNAMNEVGIVVRDIGIGIPHDEIEHIFDHFYRGERVNQSDILGAGLGLSIANKIAQTHGGRIEVDSVLNVGTTFTVWFPMIVTV